jgi:hypothetical protein
MLVSLVLGALLLALGASPPATAAASGTAASPRPKHHCLVAGTSEPVSPRRCRRHQRPLVRVDRRGRVSLRAALNAFAAAFGVVPGTGKTVRTDPRFQSGTGPLRWVLAYEDRLSKAQLRTVESASAGRLNRRTAGSGRRRDPPAGVKEEWEALVDESAERIAAHFGHQLELTLEVKILNPPNVGFAPRAQTEVFSDDPDHPHSGEPVACTVRIWPKAYNDPDIRDRRSTAAHEVWHCFQAEIIGLDHFYNWKWSPWRLEGSAEWVGNTIAEEWTGPGYSNRSMWFWLIYLDTPGWRLFERSYDAIGFYAHMAETGNDPWTRLKGILEAPGNEAAFAKGVTTNADEFADSWPSGLVRESDWGAKWNATGPGIGPAKSLAIPSLQLKAGTTATVTAPDRANALRAIDIAAPVVELKLEPGGSAHGVLRDKTGAEYPLKDATFCTDPADCCPPKKTPSNAIAAGVAILALNGGANPATAKFKGRGKKAADCEPLGPTAVSIVSPTGEYSGTSITTPGECYLSSAHPNSSRSWILNLGAFKAAVPEFHGAGGYAFPGQGAGPSAPYAVAFTGGVGPWVTRHSPNPTAGAITVNADLRSGVVLATLVSSGPPADPVSVSGTWSCSFFTHFWPGFFVG